ncbi:SseB family protein [Defluviimonas aquaemixtae]
MTAAPEDPAARLRYYERLADTELFLLLAAEPEGDMVSPRIFALEDGDFALAFDLEERLADFVGMPVPYAALPGRAAARALAGQDVGLALNLGDAACAQLLPAEALAWLAGALDHIPEAAEVLPTEFFAPRDLPRALFSAIDRRLSRLAGIATRAFLVGTAGLDGTVSHLLAFEGARASEEPVLAKAIAEAVTFSGLESSCLDVTFLSTDDPALAQIAAVAVCFELPEIPALPTRSATVNAPGMDPAHPPRLR